jgi:hypothetical protein
VNKGLWLLFITAMLSVWNAGIVWFTQLAVYPLWPLVDAQHFHDFHLTWWHDMWPSFAPVVLMFLCSVALLWVRPQGIPKWLLWMGLALQATVHTVTALFWAPIQAAMATPQGMSMLKYQQLMNTHWWRVGLFVAYAALTVWMFSTAIKANTMAGHQRETSASV